MNYLAHAFLSFSDEQLVGNMMADFIRNRERYLYPAEIQKGIALHREIDSYTDAHAEIREAKKFFKPIVGLYAGAFVDVSFDYFLAEKLAENQRDFKRFTQKTYRTLFRFSDILPKNFRAVLENMAKNDWLFNYQTEKGIFYSFQNVLNKAKYLDSQLPVFEAFTENKAQLRQHFVNFFPELQLHAENFAKNWSGWQKN